jgi:hypothetical protein
MSETIDPINLLRDTLLKQGTITATEGGNEVVFAESGIKLPRDVQTAWARKDGKGYYNLGALWFLLANKDLKH